MSYNFQVQISFSAAAAATELKERSCTFVPDDRYNVQLIISLSLAAAAVLNNPATSTATCAGSDRPPVTGWWSASAQESRLTPGYKSNNNNIIHSFRPLNVDW